MPKTKFPVEHAHLAGLRVNDLVAKVARVTLKDTTRVLKSLLLVSEFLGIDLKTLLEEDFEITRPTAEEAGLCSQAFDELQEALQVWKGGMNVEDIRALV